MRDETLQFHLDECVPGRVAFGLRQLGRSCTTTSESELRGVSDLEQLTHCRVNRKVFITRDRDFLRLANQGHEHCGIIFWTEKHSASRLIRDIDALCFQTVDSEINNAVVFV